VEFLDTRDQKLTLNTKGIYMERPKSITLAVNLLWLTLAIGPIKLLFGLSNTPQHVSIAFVLLILALTIAILVWINLKISAGRNWARMTLLVFFVIGMVPVMFQLPAEFSRSIVNGMLSLLQIGLQGFSLYLMFSNPGKDWFNNKNAKS
jgi:hypothetical protein